MRAGKGEHTIVLRFANAEALEHFVEVGLDPALVVYQADALDKEFSGNPGRNSWVIRNEGAKPESMRLELGK